MGVRQKLMERAVRRFNPAIAERALRQGPHMSTKVVKGLRRARCVDELLQLGMPLCASGGGMSDEEVLLVLTNLPDRDSAQRIALVLIEDRAAACVNILTECSSIIAGKAERKRPAKSPC